ncbi:hypothetical protein I7I53_06860 [Histoplasma capsulatum var. duboisii H88]|uniref:Uncharacterized protein n=1 Tax=Ajellomyces capsulatus (strain H88) TaxID=544711 RepID=A0A8A1LC61_AJEC8|nr:hypothetical protein I7I53_06860 [Histoplasma capsulatum var. duboisii H88]
MTYSIPSFSRLVRLGWAGLVQGAKNGSELVSYPNYRVLSMPCKLRWSWLPVVIQRSAFFPPCPSPRKRPPFIGLFRHRGCVVDLHPLSSLFFRSLPPTINNPDSCILSPVSSPPPPPKKKNHQGTNKASVLTPTPPILLSVHAACEVPAVPCINLQDPTTNNTQPNPRP